MSSRTISFPRFLLPLKLGLLLLSCSLSGLSGQDTGSGCPPGQSRVYPLILQDTPTAIFTMRMLDQDYLSLDRLLSGLVNSSFRPIPSFAVQAAAHLIVFGNLTHEEAHRSILNGLEIGSISMPFMLSAKSGYVEGVSDQTLRHLRDTDFPDFIRLHTAGLESDYMLMNRETELMNFGDENFRNLAVEFYLRKAAFMGYHLMGLLRLNTDGVEEKDELERDIVGNDIYGAVRHLHRPAMPYRRYTRYSDLTGVEKRYLDKIALRSLFNLADPALAGMTCFTINPGLKISISMGHILCPFGDLIDENFRALVAGKYRIELYARQYQNESAWFPAFGAGIRDLALFGRLELSLSAHFWEQPRGLKFDEISADAGGAVEIQVRCDLLSRSSKKFDKFSVDLGAICKTPGFLPEEISLKNHWGVWIGFSFGFGG